MFGRRRSLPWSIAVIASGWLAPSALTAAPPTRETFTLPVPLANLARPPQTHGLTVHIDATACIGIGYCPVAVTASAAGPAPTTRRFTVQITRNFGLSQAPLQVSADLELPAGATSVTAVLHVPQFVRTDSLKFDFWDEGEHLPDLSDKLNLMNWQAIAGSPYNDESLPPAILFPNHEGAQPPDVDGWQRTLTSKNSLKRALSKRALSYAPYDLPESTIDYSPWDVVLVSLDELAQVVAQRPKTWTAVRQWVAAGGNLWVYGVSHNFHRLPELDKLLDWPPAKASDAERAPQAAGPGWHGADARAGDTLESIIEQATTPLYYSNDPALAAAMMKERPALRTRLQGSTFVKRRLGLGYVVALDTTTPMTEHKAYWDLLAFEFSSRTRWHNRYGVSFVLNNPSFWNFLIPGVGLAPIGAFEVLITLFVVGIGPVNYLLLRRRHKQSLLLLTVPAGAALVTGCLLLYAVFAEGFAVRARGRSFTEIDQHRGDAACWSRIAYYAGIQPSQGLEFSLDTAVIPVDPSPELGHHRLSPVRQIEEAATRRFSKGWLPARTLAQFLTVRARTTSARLEITPAAAGAPPQLTNRLGTRIEQLLVVAADGKCSWAEAIPDGAAATLNGIERSAAADRLLRTYNAHQLQFPPAWTGNAYSTGIFGVRRQSQYHHSAPQSTGTVGDFLEQGLARLCEVKQLPPRSYLAIVERSPEFEVGLEHARLEASFHVILGHW